jgi:hypothetical protein
MLVTINRVTTQMLKGKSLFSLPAVILFLNWIPVIRVCTISQYIIQINPGIVPDTAGKQYYGGIFPVLSTYSAIQSN